MYARMKQKGKNLTLDGKLFQDLKFNFSKTIEIFQLRTTSQKDVIQVIAKDTKDNILIILTWNVKLNTEVSMHQI